MTSKTLGKLMHASVIAAAICGLIICAFVIPFWGEEIIVANPEFGNWFWPWLIFAWIIAVPCFVILIFIWKVSSAVINETVFTIKTARWVKTGAVLLFCDVALLFFGNVILFLCNMNHPGILLLSLIAVIFAVALALLAAVLSRYITKAAILQEESEGTL